jgi:hypothetical protein
VNELLELGFRTDPTTEESFAIYREISAIVANVFDEDGPAAL